MASATPSAVPNPFPPPPPGLNYIEAIRPALTFLILVTVWSAILVPILVALFFFSTRELRRKPIFICNVFSILLGLSMGICTLYAEVRAMLMPDMAPSTAARLTVAWLDFFIPFFVESILVIRILAVYPYRRTPRVVFLSIFIPLGILKIARLVNIIVFTVNYARVTAGDVDIMAASQRAWRSYPGQKIEWFLQLVDNTAASALFLWRLNKGRHIAERVHSNSRKGTYISKIEGLFWIAVSNFVFPVILCLVQLVFIFRDPTFIIASCIFLTNDYVEIIGVLLATVWTAGSHWSSNNSETGTSVSSFRVARNDNFTSTFVPTTVGVTTEVEERDIVLSSSKGTYEMKNSTYFA